MDREISRVQPFETRTQCEQAAGRKSQEHGGAKRKSREAVSHLPLVVDPLQQWTAGLHKPTSLAETSALHAVACLVCSSHQGLGKAAVGKDGAIR